MCCGGGDGDGDDSTFICSGSLTSLKGTAIDVKRRNLLFIQTILITIYYVCTQNELNSKRRGKMANTQTRTRDEKKKQQLSHDAFQSSDMNNERKSFMNRCRIPVEKKKKQPSHLSLCWVNLSDLC